MKGTLLMRRGTTTAVQSSAPDDSGKNKAPRSLGRRALNLQKLDDPNTAESDGDDGSSQIELQPVGTK